MDSYNSSNKIKDKSHRCLLERKSFLFPLAKVQVLELQQTVYLLHFLAPAATSSPHLYSIETNARASTRGLSLVCLWAWELLGNTKKRKKERGNCPCHYFLFYNFNEFANVVE